MKKNVSTAKIIKFHEFLTTMAHGALVSLGIAGHQIKAYLSADTGFFCPYKENASDVLQEGKELFVSASIEDNCDRCIYIIDPDENIGIYEASTQIKGSSELEKIVVGKVCEIGEEHEIIVDAGFITVNVDWNDSSEISIGKKVKVVGDLVFYPQKI